jgi:hypothetical protein
MDQVSKNYTNIFHCKTLQNLPKFGFLVRKQNIWQRWYLVGKKYRLAIARVNAAAEFFSVFWKTRLPRIPANAMDALSWKPKYRYNLTHTPIQVILVTYKKIICYTYLYAIFRVFNVYVPTYVTFWSLNTFPICIYLCRVDGMITTFFDFRPFSANKICVFLKDQCFDQIFSTYILCV